MKNRPKLFNLIVLCSYFIFLLFLLSTGSLRKFINPRLSFLTVFALVLLGAMIIHTMLRLNSRQKGAHSCDHGPDGHSGDCCCHHHDEQPGSLGNYLIFLPIVMSLLIAPRTLGYQAGSSQAAPPGRVSQANPLQQLNPAENLTTRQKQQLKAVAQAPGGGSEGGNGPVVAWTAPGQNSAGPAEMREYTELEIGDILFNPKKAPREKLLRSGVTMIGKVHHSGKLAPDEIVVYRMIITCCAADGLPLGLVVKLPHKMNLPAESWIGVEGSVALPPFPDRLKDLEPVANMVPPAKIYPYLTAINVYPVQAPSDEYLYPY